MPRRFKKKELGFEEKSGLEEPRQPFKESAAPSSYQVKLEEVLGLHWFEVPLGARMVDLKVIPDFVLAGITPLTMISTDPFANILMDETVNPFPLDGQLPSEAEHVHLIEVDFEVDMLSEAPLTLWSESPLTFIVPLYAPGSMPLGAVSRLIDCETCRQTRAVVGLGVLVLGTLVLVGSGVSDGISVSVGLGVMVMLGVKEGSTKLVELGNGVCEAAFSTGP